MNKSFKDLGLSKASLAAVARLGYTAPTPVQAQAIPLILKGRDVVAAAKTGTGKTAAFVLPAIDRLQRSTRKNSPSVLIVTPTRELASQIEAVCVPVAKANGHYVAAVTGGVPYGPQLKKLKGGTNILIATPGRLNDLLGRRAVSLGHIETLILDEADYIFEMGFWPTVKDIIAQTPKKRQTLLFSATIDRKVMRSVEYLLREPAFVEVAHRGETADGVDQFVVAVAQADKHGLLRTLLKTRGSKRTLVFARTKGRTDTCAKQLRGAGYDVEAIHSGKTQAQRRRALANFSKGTTDILVTTDLLARGIDVSDVEHIINFDLPDCPEDYVHRIGRTGRAGKAGDAISFVNADNRKALRSIERLVGRKIPTISPLSCRC
jgi:ATP-dependent RNA helicase RhlE